MKKQMEVFLSQFTIERIVVLATCVCVLWITGAIVFKFHDFDSTIFGNIFLVSFSSAVLIIPILAALTILVFVVKLIWQFF